MAHVEDVLRDAYELIKDREHWCQETEARTIWEETCSAHDPAAFSFCAIGAIARAAERLNDDGEAMELAVCLLRGEDHIVILNDEGTHTEVLQAFKEAIDFLDPPDELPVEARELVLA